MADLKFGTKVGRALEKLTQINADEQRALAGYPENIKTKYAKLRSELLGELDPAVRAAVLGAATAGETTATKETT